MSTRHPVRRSLDGLVMVLDVSPSVPNSSFGTQLDVVRYVRSSPLIDFATVMIEWLLEVPVTSFSLDTTWEIIAALSSPLTVPLWCPASVLLSVENISNSPRGAPRELILSFHLHHAVTVTLLVFYPSYSVLFQSLPSATTRQIFFSPFPWIIYIPFSPQWLPFSYKWNFLYPPPPKTFGATSWFLCSPVKPRLVEWGV